MEGKFGFEDLEVWQKSLNFCTQVIDLTEQMTTDRKHYRLIEQLESAASSIPANIAEGKGRYSKKEYMHFLYISRGSLYETMTLLFLFNRKKWVNGEQIEKLGNLGIEIARMLSGLISSIARSYKN